MIFKQVDEIVAQVVNNGTAPKEQTRRAYKLGEYAVDKNGITVITTKGKRDIGEAIHSVYTAAGRLKWQVGRDYAVQPGRGKPGVWWFPGGGAPSVSWSLPEEYIIKDDAWQPLRIVITDIRREPLQAISEDDAIAEGIPPDWDGYECPVAWYMDLWNSINGAGSWNANPDVWALTFRVKE